MTLIKHNDMVVPWVARWTAEIEDLTLTNKYVVPYLMGGREYNVLNEPNKRGQGDPLFAKVHSRRGARATLNQICQVCGSVKSNLYAVQPRAEGDVTLEPGMTVYGAEMPVCDDCAPYAFTVCPHLQEAERTWLRADFNGVVAAIGGMDVNPPDYFVKIENIPEHFIVKQWVVQLVVTEVLGQMPSAVTPVVEDKEAGTNGS